MHWAYPRRRGATPIGHHTAGSHTDDARVATPNTPGHSEHKKFSATWQEWHSCRNTWPTTTDKSAQSRDEISPKVHIAPKEQPSCPEKNLACRTGDQLQTPRTFFLHKV